jgi:hypothetical protein
MKRMMFLGALVLGVTVCSQSFGFELLDRMLGCKGCTSCCEPACDAGAACCEPACDAGAACCEPACDAGVACCEPGCAADAGCCGVRKKCTPIRDFLRALHSAKKCGGCTSCCEPDCSAGCEPDCSAGCCEPACAASPNCSASTKTPGKIVAVSRTVAIK